MKKYASFITGATLLASAIALPFAALAQTSQSMMPVLYNQNGAAVNNGTTAVPAGYYYLQPGVPSSQVYYYGNGTYYNASTGEYGGSINNPNGTSGAGLGYTTSGTVASTPGVPNTGAGGNAAMTWTILAVSAAIVVAGALYLGREFSRSSKSLTA